ncbi:MAG: 50S ribosomal protein L17 [Patescibacteria group bacterium]|nr:50S ribosomal protein L17 [Patescibacteria group bacterium]
MRHRKEGKKFHRLSGRRKSFVRNLVNSLIKNESIETTEVRAKAIRPVAERLITIAKKGDLASRRLINSRVIDPKITKKICDDLASRYSNRNGGYLKITKLSVFRKRDGSNLAKIEFV